MNIKKGVIINKNPKVSTWKLPKHYHTRVENKWFAIISTNHELCFTKKILIQSLHPVCDQVGGGETVFASESVGDDDTTHAG